MIFEYFDMLSGMPVYMDGVGHLCSPKLKELVSDNIGLKRYNLYLDILGLDGNALIERIKGLMPKFAQKLSKVQNIKTFEIVAILPQINRLYTEAFTFFIKENVLWDTEEKIFRVYNTNLETKENEDIGKITQENFDRVCEGIRQLNYIFKKQSPPKSFASDRARELWEKAQKAQEEINNKKKTEADSKKQNYDLGNIISKLCIIQPNYNLFNVYDLTVFQLYDQFIQARNIRSSDLGDMIFAIHGSEKYDTDNWLTPVINL